MYDKINPTSSGSMLIKASLEDRLVVERGVGGGDEICESVVLAEPDCVHRLQAGVLVGAVVARQELILKEERVSCWLWLCQI